MNTRQRKKNAKKQALARGEVIDKTPAPVELRPADAVTATRRERRKHLQEPPHSSASPATSPKAASPAKAASHAKTKPAPVVRPPEVAKGEDLVASSASLVATGGELIKVTGELVKAEVEAGVESMKDKLISAEETAEKVIGKVPLVGQFAADKLHKATHDDDAAKKDEAAE